MDNRQFLSPTTITPAQYNPPYSGKSACAVRSSCADRSSCAGSHHPDQDEIVRQDSFVKNEPYLIRAMHVRPVWSPGFLAAFSPLRRSGCHRQSSWSFGPVDDDLFGFRSFLFCLQAKAAYFSNTVGKPIVPVCVGYALLAGSISGDDS